ncbi:MAG: chemotaxis protein CheB [Chitinophagaceae bacterium]|nr:MAG: chemotaxis protein CheB [Chitinophagaceae bacterium]
MAEEKIIYSGIIVIGGSAGSLEILLKVLPKVNPRLMIPVIVVIHRKATQDTSLTELLASRSALPVKEAEEKEQLLPGVVYLCPADYHLLIEKDHTVSLDYSEKVNFSRPSIDVTMQSAAEVYKNAATGILLSGASVDGTEGLKAIFNENGYTVAQHPADAEVAYMPQQAIHAGVASRVLHRDELAQFINNLSPLFF